MEHKVSLSGMPSPEAPSQSAESHRVSPNLLVTASTETQAASERTDLEPIQEADRAIPAGPAAAPVKPGKLPAPLTELPQDQLSLPSSAIGATASPGSASDDELTAGWIQKAKEIVDMTKENPYLQEEEVSKLKAGYLERRYGRTLKANGG